MPHDESVPNAVLQERNNHWEVEYIVDVVIVQTNEELVLVPMGFSMKGRIVQHTRWYGG